jgi:hypothetical protein
VARVTREQQAQQVLARLALLDLAPLDQRVSDRRALMDLLDLLALPGLSEVWARQVRLLRQDQQELRELEQQAQPVRVEMWGQLVRREFQAHSVLQDLLA